MNFLRSLLKDPGAKRISFTIGRVKGRTLNRWNARDALTIGKA